MSLRGFCRWIGLACWVGWAVVGGARAQTSYPAGEPLIATPQIGAWRITGGNGLAAQVDVAGPGFTRAWRIETRVDASPPWAIEFRAAVNRAVSRGDVALLRFVARAVATSDESGAAFARLVVQKASANYDKSVEGTHSLATEWREFFVPFAFGADYAANAAEVAFGFGFKRQTVEIGGFDFVYYGKTVALASLPRSRPSYVGREDGAAWRMAALARIEQIRKGDFAVAVVDATGKPVPGATVRVEQRKSAFQFGSALQMARIAGATDTADNRTYRQKVLELFNAASTENDLKWGAWDGEWGAAYTKTQTTAGLAWLKHHGLHVRGHVLVWPGWKNLPASIQALQGTARQSEIPGRALAHIAEIVDATREWVDEWDVLNEPYANHDLMDVFGAAIQAEWFKAARAASAKAPLFLNDYSNHDASLDAGHVTHFETTARYLNAQGAPLGGLGLQGHISASPSPPVNVLAVLDRYAALGLPVRVTEFDINTDDEDVQADYTRDFLIAMYSHASVVGVQLWGFWEGAHWIPQAAMYRRDWTEKPNGRAYRAWVLDAWRTRATGTTDAAGTWRGRGFHGDYVVTVEWAGKSYEQVFALRAGAAAPVIRVPLAAARLTNLSTRGTAGAGDATMITGFFVEGPAAKRVLVRGVGPGLAGFGVSGVLARPELTLRRADGAVVATNRGWDAGTVAEANGVAATAAGVGAFALAAQSGDCALVATLEPGAYTAPVTSLDGGTGVALVEVYDLDTGSSAAAGVGTNAGAGGGEGVGVSGGVNVSADASARLKNLSTRVRVAPGAGVAIPGLVIAEENARTVLVRAVGPGLGAFGVSGTLARPSLVVMAGGEAVAANAGWETSADSTALTAAAGRVGAFTLQAGRADAALIATLPAGAWTIQVSGADGGSGVVLVEVYDLSS